MDRADKQKAVQNQIPFDEQLDKDARFLYDSKYGSTEVKEILNGIRSRIHNTPVWLDQIKEKAKGKNISVEQMLELDVIFVYDMENKKDAK